MIFCKDNHLSYWYNDEPDSLFRKDRADLLNFSLGSISRDVYDFRRECQLAAEEIYSIYPDIHVGLTGGLDSNICLESFLSAGIKPGVFIIRFPGGLNSFDAERAEETCVSSGIRPVIIEFDPIGFIQDGLIETVEKYQIYSFYQAIHIEACRQLSVPHLSVDEIEIRRDVSPEIEWCFVKREDQDMCWRRYAVINQVPALNNFYTWSPELMLSFLHLPTVKRLIANEIEGKLTWNSSKREIYQEGGFSSLWRYKKTWGIEKFYPEWEFAESLIKRRTEFAPRSCYVNYEELTSALNGQGGSWKYI